MIPKKLHYVWFGKKELPELARKCIQSWEKHCPNYEIVRWDENNFDIDSCPYVKEAYQAEKFAFVSDYVRLYAILSEGGIYLDTDVELLRPLDGYLSHQAFSGFESMKNVPTGIMGCEKGNQTVRNLLDGYNGRHFIKADGSLDMTTNCVSITEYFTGRGLLLNGHYQEIDGFAFYPSGIFCPKQKKLENAVTIHHFSGSWKSEQTKKRESSFWWKAIVKPGSLVSRLLYRLFGNRYKRAKDKLRDQLFK